jgi:hypothetical protein
MRMRLHLCSASAANSTTTRPHSLNPATTLMLESHPAFRTVALIQRDPYGVTAPGSLSFRRNPSQLAQQGDPYAPNRLPT